MNMVKNSYCLLGRRQRVQRTKPTELIRRMETSVIHEWWVNRKSEWINELMGCKLTDYRNVLALASKVHWIRTHQKIWTSQISDAWEGDDQTWVNLTQNNYHLCDDGRCQWKKLLADWREGWKWLKWVTELKGTQRKSHNQNSLENERVGCMCVASGTKAPIAKKLLLMPQKILDKEKGRLNCWNA